MKFLNIVFVRIKENTVCTPMHQGFAPTHLKAVHQSWVHICAMIPY